MKKDFSKTNTQPIYKAQLAKATDLAPAKKTGKKAVATSFSLTPDMVEYIDMMRSLTRQTRSAFVADLIRENMDKNREVYEQVSKLSKQV